MATIEAVTLVKGLVGVAGADLNDEALGLLIDASAGDTNLAAKNVWASYAAKTANYVTISESGSSRSMGDVHKNALAMVKYFDGLLKVEEPVVPSSDRPRTRPIERA